ncbi:hypothetical protein C8F01DRAFT_1378651 [Mycena amicta]|nr:hypothetical protein C8F01DRAFT_1378651 [Mycena amicta]
MTRNSELRSQFAEAQARIADLERQLATLRAHETRLKDELGAIVYPILTIPTEIATEILCHAAAGSVPQSLLAATSVCSLWRDIALATPRLWSEFHSNPWSSKALHDPASLLQQWLFRSGCMPLYITVPSYRTDRRLVALLAKHISRWRCVDLIGERRYHEMLEDLPEPSLGLRDATQLVDVDLDACPKWRSLLLLRAQNPGPLLPTVKHVTSLVLPYVTSAFLSMLLPHTPALEFLSLSGDFAAHLPHTYRTPTAQEAMKLTDWAGLPPQVPHYGTTTVEPPLPLDKVPHGRHILPHIAAREDCAEPHNYRATTARLPHDYRVDNAAVESNYRARAAVQPPTTARYRATAARLPRNCRVQSAAVYPGPIVLARVHTLHYGGRRILHHISLPALQSLRLTNYLLPLAQEIGPFMTRSACVIQTLCLERLERMPGPTGLSCLRAISSVPEFTATYRHELYADDDKHRECVHRISEFLDALAEGTMLASVEEMTLLQIPYCISSALREALHDKIHLASSRLKKLTIQVNEDNEPPEQWSSVLASKGVEIGVLYYDQDNPPRSTYY